MYGGTGHGVRSIGRPGVNRKHIPIGGLIPTHVSSTKNLATIQFEMPGNLELTLSRPDTWKKRGMLEGGGRRIGRD